MKVLAVAPLHWSAGYDDLLLALRLLADDGEPVSLRVEADGPARERFLFTVMDLGLEDRVVLTDPPGPPGRRVAVPDADVVALAAVEDRPWPETAHAAGRSRAVAATDLSWVRSNLVGSGRRVVLVPPRDPARFAGAILDACP
jgi:glycosyltransferase involved in cell wall biosynthesis